MDVLRAPLMPAEWIDNHYAPALIVDDDELIQQLTQSQLLDIGISDVLLAGDGEQALNRLRTAGHLRLIVLDLSMPNVDGVALIKDIAKYQPQSSLIILSAMEDGLLRSAQLLAKFHGLKLLGAVPKPMRKTTLSYLLANGLNCDRVTLSRDSKVVQMPSPAELPALLSGVELHYQPKINLQTNQVVGCEALARLRLRDEDGEHLIMPNHFVPYFESQGKMGEFSRMVITRALSGMRVFAAAGIDVQVSINLSMSDLENISFPELLTEQISRAGVPAERLTIEITETCMALNPKNCIETASRLRLMGFGVSIDDFGTGYSSLKQLKEMPFNELKIDRSFVSGISRNKEVKAIAEACIGIAGAFGLHCVAEGIETEEEKNMLTTLGCEIGQGYLFSKALPEKEFIAWCQRWQASVATTCEGEMP